MKQTLIFSLLLVLSARASAQQTPNELMKRRIDSLKTAYIDEYALKFPLARQAGISVESIAGGEMKSKLNGSDFFKGHLQLTRVNGYINVPIARIKKFSFSSSIGLSHQYAKLNEVTNYNDNLPVSAMTSNRTTVSASLNVTRVDSLFNRPIVYAARVAQLFDPTNWKMRFSGSGIVSLTLKKTANTTIGVGAFIIVDPASPMPFAPYISYYHKFENRKLEFFLDPPTRIALRKELSPKNSLTLHTTLGGSTVFMQANNQIIFPQDHLFSTIEIKSGLLFEQRLAHKMVLGISGGVTAALEQKSMERTDLNNEPFMKASQKPLPYLNVGVSFLPFWQK